MEWNQVETRNFQININNMEYNDKIKIIELYIFCGTNIVSRWFLWSTTYKDHETYFFESQFNFFP